MRKPYQVREFTPAPNANGKYGSKVCIHCGNEATKEALFKEDGITVAEKYCGDCMKTENFSAIMTFYGRN